jgi:hypothetical protein
MFRIPLLRRHTIVSDEGFAITFTSRKVLRYDEGDISLLFDIDGDGKRMDPIANSMRTSEPNDESPDEMTLRRIEDNIARALEWRGWSVQVVN